MRYNEIYRQITDYVIKSYPSEEHKLYRIVLICDLMDLALKYEHLHGRLKELKTYEEVKQHDN